MGQIWFAPRLVLVKRLFESRIISVMKISMLRILLVLFSAALATAQGGSYPKPQISSAKGQQAPDFTLQDQDGRAFTLSQQQGHWVLLFFYRGHW